jgi:hypothetical protein
MSWHRVSSLAQENMTVPTAKNPPHANGDARDFSEVPEPGPSLLLGHRTTLHVRHRIVMSGGPLPSGKPDDFVGSCLPLLDAGR